MHGYRISGKITQMLNFSYTWCPGIETSHYYVVCGQLLWLVANICQEIANEVKTDIKKNVIPRVCY